MVLLHDYRKKLYFSKNLEGVQQFPGGGGGGGVGSKFFYRNPYEPVHEISNNVVCETSKDSDQPAHMRSLIRALACRLNIL